MATRKDTPLMRQYHSIKQKHPDTVLLFRLGDFFETFEDDAHITAKVCGITLTKRNNGEAGDTPLAGFPHHQLDNYLPKLVRAGYRVAVCEQLEDPKQARGIVRRDVVEVVTPGIAFGDKLLDSKKNNYVAAISLIATKHAIIIGYSCADVSTGEYFTAEISADAISDIIEATQPAEILLSKTLAKEMGGASAQEPSSAIHRIVQAIGALSHKPILTKREDWIFEEIFCREQIIQHFKTASLKGFGIDTMSAGIVAAGAVLHYIHDTQKNVGAYLRPLSVFHLGDGMILDSATKRNLEITLSLYDQSREGTLIGILDKTETAMGARLLKKWITRPLCAVERIQQRLSAVRALVQDHGLCLALRQELHHVGDIERLVSRVCTARATPRDLVALRSSLEHIIPIQRLLASSTLQSLHGLAERFQSPQEVLDLLHRALPDEAPALVGGGDVFRMGYSQEIDDIRSIMYSAKTWLADYQERERQTSGISSLKVSFYGVFGYYIEITHTHKHRIPDYYERKQTLTNAERYITPELKEMESKILHAEENIATIERTLFQELRLQIANYADMLLQNAELLAITDCLHSFAQCAVAYNFCEPTVDTSETLTIVRGRHPVVERLLPLGESFTANSTTLNTETEQIHIITGPNMSGKSSYLRQVGLIVLLAQIGSFVPAESAHIGLVDRIFTRVGAQDNITQGESTFLVEMQEAANIINNASRKSLILLDEVGRGTATFDGIAIARAIAEYIHQKIGARTLFATHYHELTSLAEEFSRIANYKADVRETGTNIVFLRSIVKGSASHSFGIHVAAMAGLPKDLTDRADTIMHELESSSSHRSLLGIQTNDKPIQAHEISHEPSEPQFSLFEIRDDRLREQIRNIDLHSITPIQALGILEELQKQVR